MVAPIIREEVLYRVIAMTPLRERRLLAMAMTPGHNHKAFYSQYCYLIERGYVRWTLGTAFLTAEGEKRLVELSRG